MPTTTLENILEVSRTRPSRWLVRLISVEPNGIKHILSEWQALTKLAQVKKCAAQNEATIKEVD